MNALNEHGRTLGLIGLGLVGTALAQRFQQAGFHVIGYDIDPGRRSELAGRGIRIADSALDAAKQIERIVLSLPNSTIVEQVLFGENGIAGSTLENAVIIDTTTGDPADTESIAKRLKAIEISYLDACIIGSSRHVAEGKCVVSAGGDPDAIERCRDIFDAFTESLFHLGPSGKGNQAKLVVNLVLGLNRLVLSEGIHLAEALDLDLKTTLDLLKSGVSYSRVMDTKGDKMLSGDFKPEARLAQHLKDVELILQLGQRAGIHLGMSELHQKILEAGVSLGLGNLDNSAVIEILRHDLTEEKS